MRSELPVDRGVYDALVKRYDALERSYTALQVMYAEQHQDEPKPADVVVRFRMEQV